jgi:hypothetical protein
VQLTWQNLNWLELEARWFGDELDHLINPVYHQAYAAFEERLKGALAGDRG